MIFHLAEKSTWDTGPPYLPGSLRTEGFIHCSTASQLLDVANAMYSGRSDLVLLTIDPDYLSTPLVYEDCYESGQRFPHIYGTINPQAVVRVERLQPSADGTFSWAVIDIKE
jgi:uncharacterized protein (DUF952 family)